MLALKRILLAALCPLALAACSDAGDISRDGDADEANTDAQAPAAPSNDNNDGGEQNMDRPNITDSMQAVGAPRNGNGQLVGDEAGEHQEKVDRSEKKD